MKLYRLVKPDGSTKNRKRLGRGPGSGKGKTCGKGHKGQKSRSGYKYRPWMEGGQMPLMRRLPKRGFTNIFGTTFQVVNVGDLEKKFPTGGDIDIITLKQNKLINSSKAPVKILGVGELKAGMNLKVQAASKSALEKIKAAGGNVEFIK